MKLNYLVISSSPLKIKFFYQDGEKYGEFYLEQTSRDARDANNPNDKLGIRGEMEIVRKDQDYALDLTEMFGQAMGLNFNLMAGCTCTPVCKQDETNCENCKACKNNYIPF